ncbi:hypothetical protein [Polaribacter aquimarinus]|uniref:Uncharacterized protein n=1 Tax=Polaribacter aquimarinus TaxID=2100726 RepID=A0A2U2JDS4_9FLAO|nr:hypothetical protein [Polaribacter aquimarinus]PWG06462.1 hypothetical protein DIS07_01120 [Polaribacter aquimarinus]
MNFEKILKKASLKLYNDCQKLKVESKFYLSDRGNLGLLFFLVLALFLIYISFFEVKEIGVQVFLLVISVAILFFTIIVIIKQLKDFVEVSRRTIKFSNNLKEKEIQLNSEFKIKVESQTIHTKSRRNSRGSYFSIIQLFLKINGEKYRILDFQVDKKDSKEAKALGKEIKRLILEKVNYS